MTTREWNVSPKVFVGNLPEDTTKEDLQEVFQRYGKIREMWLFGPAGKCDADSESKEKDSKSEEGGQKAPKTDPTSFAMIEFEEDTQADGAVRALGDPTVGLSKAKRMHLEMMAESQMGRERGHWMRGRGGGGARGRYGGYRQAPSDAPAYPSSSRGAHSDYGSSWRGGEVLPGTSQAPGRRDRRASDR